jgi:hypothetical protein
VAVQFAESSQSTCRLQHHKLPCVQGCKFLSCGDFTCNPQCTLVKSALAKINRGVNLISDALPFGRLW